jgi:transcriptional regulator with XRE-family HTH domain
MTLGEYLKKQMKNPLFRKAWEELEPEYQLAKSLIEARLAKGLTQRGLAKKVGTKQPAIARLESGEYGKVSLPTLRKVAQALGQRVQIRLIPERAKQKSKAA